MSNAVASKFSMADLHVVVSKLSHIRFKTPAQLNALAAAINLRADGAWYTADAVARAEALIDAGA